MDFQKGELKELFAWTDLTEGRAANIAAFGLALLAFLPLLLLTNSKWMKLEVCK